jgi:hypothetical protein
MSAVAAVLSIVYVTGSIFACCVGCYRSRTLGRRLDSLEEKLEKQKSIPLVYSVPVYSLPPGATAPTAPPPTISSSSRITFEPVSPA